MVPGEYRRPTGGLSLPAILRVASLLATAVLLIYGLFTGLSSVTTDPEYSPPDDTTWLVCAGIAFLVLTCIWLPLQLAGTSERTTYRQVAHLGQNTRFQASVTRLGGFFMIALCLLALHALREQVIASDSINNLVVGRNWRPFISEFSTQRGTIYAGNSIVATSQPVSGSIFLKRTYPEPGLSYVAGYYNPLVFGLSRLEATYDAALSRAANRSALDEVLHRPRIGADLHLTLETDLQAAANEALGERPGAIVLLDVQTGAILAMSSWPNPDPQQMSFDASADDWNAEMSRAMDYYNSIKDAPDSPFWFRPTQGSYSPGSTFKTITAAAALDKQLASPTSVFTDTDGTIQVQPGGNIHVDCDGCLPADHGPQFTLTEAYQWSLNVVFAQLATELGHATLEEYAHRFGFGLKYDLGLGEEVSLVQVTDGAMRDRDTLAASGYGQGEVLVSPLQMALVAATIARGGDLPAPYLVASITDPTTGRVLSEFKPHSITRSISPESAAAMRQMMVTSVEEGWASEAAIEGYTVGGKTGTAENSSGAPHSWFIAWGGKDIDHAKYAVAAVLDNGGEGSMVALPAATSLLRKALYAHVTPAGGQSGMDNSAGYILDASSLQIEGP